MIRNDGLLIHNDGVGGSVKAGLLLILRQQRYGIRVQATLFNGLLVEERIPSTTADVGGLQLHSSFH